MPTPLYDALKEYAQKNPARFHMPGHKGKFLPAPELAGLAPIDLTELLPTGNLYEAGEPFDSAQRLWAELFGFDFCQFLTGGSTMGIHTGLALCAGPGEKALVDRGCHRAVFNALALLDLEPVWLERPWLDSENMIGPISPGQVEKMLDQHSDIKTVCITSPTYAGVLSDVEVISQIVHARGGTLFVDGAHGAHLPFLGVDPFRGADAAAVSAHKTLPAMGQSALLFVNGVDPDRVRRTASIFGSSSPSYPMLVSMDLARDWLLGEGRWEYRRTACRVFEFRQAFPSLKDGLSLDPCRLTLKVKDGPAFARALEERGIFPEMEDGGHVVLICSAQDSDGDLYRLEGALVELRERMGDCAPIPAPPLPERVSSPRAALFAPGELRTLRDCEGEVSACQIAPYPPGVPVVAPGERITKKELAYLEKIGYNMLSEVRVISEA
ncbi:MAG: aminotransferase class V-fold PLP-dependent enzyme [Lawsonibacter sp.]|jgi:arginine/lysine/ornithine decarboxylase|nr:aminotransferase class V-fold PLP-dependent enzyme [Lawsonibacter sp.]